jgi:hypothetical protein
MKISEILALGLQEGGWSDVVTQGTVITPEVVRSALTVVKRFTMDFNKWLASQNQPTVKMGNPLGSTAWHARDSADATYGDIDLQMIAPVQDASQSVSQLASQWNTLADKFVADVNPSYVYDQGKPSAGHIIFQISQDQYVQVDMIWTPGNLATWARYRMTPSHKVKGAMYGNLFSTLGEIMHISIQSSGAQIKVKDGEAQPFAKSRKYDAVETLSQDIERFGLDILVELYKKIYPDRDVKTIVVDPLLQANPGIDPENITAQRLVDVIKGIARSFQANKMYGHFNLKHIQDYSAFIAEFKKHYLGKLDVAVNSTKFDKAASPQAQAKAAETKNKMITHGTAIMKMF